MTLLRNGGASRESLQVGQAEPGIHALAAQQEIFHDDSLSFQARAAGTAHEVEFLPGDSQERPRARIAVARWKRPHQDKRSALIRVQQGEFLCDGTAKACPQHMKRRLDR
jgi:hypothetical protein